VEFVERSWKNGSRVVPNTPLTRRVRIATDCAAAVKSLAGPGMDRYDQVIRELKTDMASFDKAEVVHEGRASNLDAHRLARSSIYEDQGGMFGFRFLPMEFVPTLLMFN
jgi:hypothetical protein